MPPIERNLMGDVWPAVEPGKGRDDYGSATLSPTDPCVVRSFQTFKLTYRVGRFGLDDTGAIRVSFRWVNDCGPLQTHAPAAMNFVTATASNGVPLTLFVEPYGYRPWSLALRVTVTGGYMREGDEISILFGDIQGGSPGMQMQTISEDAFEFKVSADVCATGQFNELEQQLSVPIIAGPPVSWHLVGPGLRRPGEPFDLGIRTEDYWGNPAVPDRTDVHLRTDSRIEGLPSSIMLPTGARTCRIEGVSISELGAHEISLTTPAGRTLATANPIVIRDGSLPGYWGDLHGQSGETVGIGSIEQYLEFARDIAFLDVTGHQGNDFQMTNAFWAHLNSVTERLNSDGKLIVFPGYEWSGNTPVGGDHNVFFRNEGRQIRRSSHAMLVDRSDLATDANTLDQLFDALAEEDCILWSHIGGRPADVSYAHDARLKTAVEVHSNWGTFEWALTDSLALGHRVGVVSNSDGHKGRPGAGAPGATEFGAYGGLTCFLASELTRDAIFECMRRRHHYGTSGSRIGLDIRAKFEEPASLFIRDPDHFDIGFDLVEEAMMGDIVRLGGGGIRLRLQVDAASPIERIEVMRGSEQLISHKPYGFRDLGSRLRVIWQGAEYRGRGRNTHWRGRLQLSGAEIQTMAPINHWNPERRLDQTGPNQVIFEGVTSGNFAGVDLWLDQSEGEIMIDSNHVSGSAAISDLGLDDLVLDAGGLDRQIRIRRLPDRLDATAIDEQFELPVHRNEDAAIWARITTEDGHQAWSSPIYFIQ
ncbi:MAG: DUF3604 domain-containing protein [Pseudomonadota bacterium]